MAYQMLSSLRVCTYTAVTGLALLVANCGEVIPTRYAPNNTREQAAEMVTIEGTVYLTPAYLRTPLQSSQGLSRSPLTETQTILTKGLVEASCGASTKVGELTDRCQPGQDYISSSTVSRDGNYEVTVPKNVADTVGTVIIAKDSDGSVAGGTYVSNPLDRELYPTVVPPRRNITPETTASTQLLYGVAEKIKETHGTFTYDNLTQALGAGAEFFARMPAYFERVAIKTVDEYFTKAENDRAHQKEIGDIVKPTIGSQEESTVLGADIIQKAGRVNLGGGNFIEVTETPRQEVPGGEPSDGEPSENQCNRDGYQQCNRECVRTEETCLSNTHIPEEVERCWDERTNCQQTCCAEASCYWWANNCQYTPQ